MLNRFNLIHLFGTVCCVSFFWRSVTIASLLVALDVLLIFLIKFLLNSRLVRSSKDLALFPNIFFLSHELIDKSGGAKHYFICRSRTDCNVVSIVDPRKVYTRYIRSPVEERDEKKTNGTESTTWRDELFEDVNTRA